MIEIRGKNKTAKACRYTGKAVHSYVWSELPFYLLIHLPMGAASYFQGCPKDLLLKAHMLTAAVPSRSLQPDDSTSMRTKRGHLRPFRFPGIRTTGNHVCLSSSYSYLIPSSVAKVNTLLS